MTEAITEALMGRFYRNYFENGMGKLAALREAQLWILNGQQPLAQQWLERPQLTQSGHY